MTDLTEIEVRSIALFFYFSLLDDNKVHEAASEALGLCRNIKSRNSSFSVSTAIVVSTHKIWNKYKTKVYRGSPNTSLESGWILPAKTDLGPWLEFQKLATEEELLAVLWVKVLQLSEEDVSIGLGITEGTVRYRLGRALRKLGGMIHQDARF